MTESPSRPERSWRGGIEEWPMNIGVITDWRRGERLFQREIWYCERESAFLESDDGNT